MGTRLRRASEQDQMGDLHHGNVLGDERAVQGGNGGGGASCSGIARRIQDEARQAGLSTGIPFYVDWDGGCWRIDQWETDWPHPRFEFTLFTKSRAFAEQVRTELRKIGTPEA